MYEVELKIPADHDAVRDRLAELGAESRGTVEQVDTYYDHPTRDFGDTDEALRLREVDRDGEASTRVTYKGPLVDPESKTREEHETAVADGEELAAVLDRLGFAPTATVEKTREEYELDGFAVTLDDVEGVGTFVEVEREVETDVEATRDEAKELVRRIGLDPSDGVRESYLAMSLDADDRGAGRGR